MKVIGFYQQPKFSTRPLCWVYSGTKTRKYAPTPSSRSRLARLLLQAKKEGRLSKVYKHPQEKINHYTIFKAPLTTYHSPD